MDTCSALLNDTDDSTPPPPEPTPSYSELLLRLYTKTHTRFFYYLDYTLHSITPSNPLTHYSLWIILGTIFNFPATSLRNFFNSSYTFNDTSYERASDIAAQLQAAIADACLNILNLETHTRLNNDLNQKCHAAIHPHNHSLPNSTYDNVFQDTLNYVQHGTNTIWYAAIIFFTLSSAIGLTTVASRCWSRNSTSPPRTSEQLNELVLHEKLLSPISSLMLIYWATCTLIATGPLYQQKTDQILSADSKNPLYRQDLLTPAHLQPPLCLSQKNTMALLPQLFFLSFPNCSNLEKTRGISAFSYIYIAMVLCLQEYSALKAISGLIYYAFTLFNRYSQRCRDTFQSISTRCLTTSDSDVFTHINLNQDDLLSRHQIRQTYSFRYYTLILNTRAQTTESSPQPNNWGGKLYRVLKESLNCALSSVPLSTFIISASSLICLVAGILATESNNETCNSIFELMFYDDCSGRSKPFALLNRSCHVEYFSKTLNHTDTNNIGPLLNTNAALVEKLSFLSCSNQQNQLDLLFRDQLYAKNGNHINVLSSLPRVEVNAIYPLMIYTLALTTATTFVGKLTYGFYTTCYPPGGMHHKLTSLFDKLQLFLLCTSAASTITFKLNPYVFMALLLSTTLASGINEAGQSWDYMTFLEKLANATEHTITHSATTNSSLSDAKKVYTIESSSQLAAWDGAMLYLSSSVVALTTAIFLHYYCKPSQHHTNDAGSNYIALTEAKESPTRILSKTKNHDLTSRHETAEMKDNQTSRLSV